MKSLFKGNSTAEETEERVRPEVKDLPEVSPGETCGELSRCTDANGDTAVLPAQFHVSKKESEQTIRTGLLTIGPDGSEFVWIPTTVIPACAP